MAPTRDATPGAVYAARAIRTDGAVDALTQSGVRALRPTRAVKVPAAPCGFRTAAAGTGCPQASRVADITHVTISALGEATLRT